MLRLNLNKMSEDSNLPSAIRDSDAVDDNSTVGPQSGRSSASSGTREPADGHSRIGVLERKLEQQAKQLSRMTEAFETLQTAYVERIENVERDLKKK